jgi:hypothetical protein
VAVVCFMPCAAHTMMPSACPSGCPCVCVQVFADQLKTYLPAHSEGGSAAAHSEGGSAGGAAAAPDGQGPAGKKHN